MKKGWEKSTLGDTCEMYQPKTISGKEMVVNGAYPVFGANGMIGRYDKFNHEEPQLLITCRGATCGSVNISEPKSWITGNAMVVRSKNGLINMRFLEYLFRGGIQISKAITGAAQPQITRTNLEPLEICYPKSLSEQQRIVGILDEAFAGLATAMSNAEKNLQNAKALFESHLNEVFTKKSEGWNSEQLDALTEEDSPITYGVVKPGDEGEIKFVRGGDLVRGKVRLNELRTITKAVSDQYRRTLLKGGELLICLVGQPGQVAVAPKELAGANIARQVGLIRLKGCMDAEFVRFFLQSPIGAEALGARESGSVQQVINLSELRQVSVPCPKIDEQREITTQLDTLSAETQRLADIYTRKLAALDELKKSLLHQAFSGEL